jgi:autotransporter-associated beta strand protein
LFTADGTLLGLSAGYRFFVELSGIGLLDSGITVDAGGSVHNIAYVNDNGSNLFYYDFSLVASANFGAINAAGANFSLGFRASDTSLYYTGTIDEARLFTFASGQFNASNLSNYTPGSYWAPSVGGGGTGTWSVGNNSWASVASTQGNGLQSKSANLLFSGATGSVTVSNNVNVAAGLTFSTDGYTFTNGTITLTGATFSNNAVTTAPSVGTTINSQLAGANGMFKDGSGTLTLGGTTANTLTGLTAVAGGTLNLNKSADTTAIAGDVAVGPGATLLISQSDQVINSAAVTLSGGTITRGAGVSEVFGSLNITGSGILDFGTGAVGNLTFGTYQNNQQTESALLTLNNFMPGNSFTFSNALFAADGSNVGSYFSFGTGYINSSIINNGGSSFTITAIPEPSTVLAAIGLAGMFAWPLLTHLHARGRSARQPA